jgi:hypothetical protein
MLKRIGKSENTQIIILALAILLYLLIQVAEASDLQTFRPKPSPSTGGFASQTTDNAQTSIQDPDDDRQEKKTMRSRSSRRRGQAVCTNVRVL